MKNIYFVIISSIFMSCLKNNNKEVIIDRIPPTYINYINKDYLDSLCSYQLCFMGYEENISPLLSLHNNKFNFYIIKYNKKENFHFEILKSKSIEKQQTDFDKNFLTGVYDFELMDSVENLRIEVENYQELDSGFYRVQSQTFKMIENEDFVTKGYFKKGEFYIQIKNKQNDVLINVFSANNDRSIQLLKRILR